MDVYQMGRQEASNILTLWACGMVVGCPLAGLASDRWFRTRRGVCLAGSFLFCATMTVLCIATASIPVWALYALFFLAGFAQGTGPVSYALLNDTLPGHIVGTALGFYNLFSIAGGAVLQQFTGLLLAQFPGATGLVSTDGYRWLFLICAIGLVISGLSVLAVREERPPIGIARNGGPVKCGMTR